MRILVDVGRLLSAVAAAVALTVAAAPPASAVPLVNATLDWVEDGGLNRNGSIDLLTHSSTGCADEGKTGSCENTGFIPPHGLFTVNNWFASWDTDPFVTNDMNVSNNSGVTIIFDVTVTSPVVVTGPQTNMDGSVGLTLSNTPNPAGSALLTDAGGQDVYRALIDGSVVRSLLDAPYSLTCGPPTCTTVDTEDFGIPVPELGPQANTDIGIRTRFALGPGDRVGYTSIFRIEAVPEPGTAALLVVGLVGLAAARRRLAN